MAQLILDGTQTQIVLQARDQVRVCDPDGKVLGVIAPATNERAGGSICTDEEIEAAKRALAAPGPRYATKEVLDSLRAGGGGSWRS